MKTSIDRSGSLAQSKKAQIKRYSLKLPQELFNELQSAADSRGVAVVDLIRAFVKLGLIVLTAEEDGDASLIIRQGESEREIVTIF